MSGLLDGLFGDPQLATLLDDAAMLAAMVRVERALALAGVACGLLPPVAAGIDAELAGVGIDPQELAAGTTAAGVVVPALVTALRQRLSPGVADHLHWGATSQDITDTALVLQLRAVLEVLAGRLDRVIAALADQAERHAGLPMAGRTRSQIAAPMTFGLRIAQWLHPLLDLRDDLGPLRARLARVQFGGAVGANTAVAPYGPALAAALARELGLEDSPPWHTNRVGLGGLAAWAMALTAALSKLAGDLMLMGRREAPEAAAGLGGGSSTMPQKSNPVAAEAMVTCARLVAALAPPLIGAVHAEERDGPPWMLEWLVLPQILVASGAALRHAQGLAETLAPDAERMRAGLSLDGGAALAEAASFALARHLPRAQAQAMLKSASAETRASGTPLATALAAFDTPIDWDAALDPGQAVAPAGQIIAAILARARG